MQKEKPTARSRPACAGSTSVRRLCANALDVFHGEQSALRRERFIPRLPLPGSAALVLSSVRSEQSRRDGGSPGNTNEGDDRDGVRNHKQYVKGHLETERL